MEHLKHPKDISLQTITERRIEGILSPLESFIRKQAAAGVLLMLATLIALVVANSPWQGLLKNIAGMEFGFHLRDWIFSLPIGQWVSEGLLALFFFLIGLEIKREMLVGQLRQPHRAFLVIVAAVGGMIMPALIYWALNCDGPGHSGWAIPMATDTAFAIGVLALLARHVSLSASIFLAALAIIDDIISILVIAVFYAHELHYGALLKAFVPLGLLFACNITGVRRGWIYAVLGGVLWWYVHESGVHSTLAGLLLALTVPARSRIGQRSFIDKIRRQITDFENEKEPGKNMLSSNSQHHLAEGIEETVRHASTPLQRWHASLENPIAIIVLPLFALFNAGVPLTGENVGHALTSSVAIGIIAGLVIGKPLGITLFSLLALRLKVAKMPDGMRFTELIGVGLLAGIGFTMSLFITVLGFEHHPDLIESAKVGILFSSLLAATLGAVWLYANRGMNRSFLRE